MGLKRFGTILLLLLILQYTFGLFTVYLWNSLAIKQSMKAAIAAGSFQPNQVITISLQNPTQPEAKRWQHDEININGKMYDVVSAQQANGRLTLKCICDEDENLLIATYKQAVEEGHKSSPQKSSISLKNIFSPFVINNGGICFLRMEANHAPQLLQYQTIGIKPLFEGVPTPPPRQV